ncbi:MAG: TrkA family potassium uptake protein [Planctomycetes bacterium]|nr:TrkA family potassium uptake protein [Planctomycetota bacterium]
MRTTQRRARAWINYLRKPLRRFLPLFAFAMAVVLLGGVAFYFLYDRPLTFSQSVWTAFALLTGEPILDWPRHWVLELLYFVLPILGLVVVLDGLIRFSYYAFRRDEMSPDWVRAMSDTMSNHVVLFGLGKVGFRVLQQLIALGEHAVVIEKDEHCPNIAFARNHAVPVRIGTGREEGILADVNIKGAKSLICATNDDLANLELAIDARKLRPKLRIVLRMYDQELAEKIGDTMDIHLAFSTAMLAAPLFATASMDPCILNSFYVDKRLLVIARLTIPDGSELVGKSVGELVREHQLVVVTYKRGEGTVFHPPTDVVIESADVVTVECEPGTLKTLHGLNGTPTPV